MDTKKILVVSSAFYPENSPRSFRTTELVKELARQGKLETLVSDAKEKARERKRMKKSKE